MIGYVQIYFKIVGEKETYYAEFDGDFGKPLTTFRLWNIRKRMKRLFGKFDKVYAVKYCSKEEWEQNRDRDEITVKWDDRDGG